MIANAPDLRRAGGDCGCGCGGACACESRCCDLECVVRPNYFCGQTLTDRDLTAMVEWARTRFGLARYRDGWGVVCGLDVTCSGPDDPCCGADGDGPSVFVHPGYAVDCCGNDLVVCKPMRVDLSSVCVEWPDPCADLGREKAQVAAGDLSNNVDDGRDPGEIKRLEDGLARDPCAPWKDRSSLFAVDLSLRYHEELFQGQRTMFRNNCSDAQPCGYSRIQEAPCVHLEISRNLREAENDDARTWEDEFRAALKNYIAELRREIGGADAAAILRYIRRHRLSYLCFLEDYLCCVLERNGKGFQGWEAQVGVWMLIDWMLTRLRCDCASCKPDLGVKIGRVVLRRIKVRGGVRCRLVTIDTGPRYRRALEKSCRPIPPGSIDLAQYLWQPVREVEPKLAAQKVVLSPKGRRRDNVEIESLSEPLITVKPESEIYAMTLDDPLGTARIAAFLRTV